MGDAIHHYVIQTNLGMREDQANLKRKGEEDTMGARGDTSAGNPPRLELGHLVPINFFPREPPKRGA